MPELVGAGHQGVAAARTAPGNAIRSQCSLCPVNRHRIDARARRHRRCRRSGIGTHRYGTQASQLGVLE
eukprot:17468-Prymnesium_polylepis.1